MKRITHKCPCGAEAVFEDSQDKKIRYVDDGSGKDLSELDDEYVVEFWARNFLASHAACRQAKKETDSARPQWQTIFTTPKPDPDECAEQRSNRADRLAEDCSPTKEGARKHAELLASQRPGVFHFYRCNVGGKEHWHVEQIEADSIVANRGYHWYHIDQIEQWEKAARQQERERCAKIIYKAEPKIEYLEGDDFTEEIDKDEILWKIFETDGKPDDHPNREALKAFYKQGKETT